MGFNGFRAWEFWDNWFWIKGFRGSGLRVLGLRVAGLQGQMTCAKSKCNPIDPSNLQRTVVSVVLFGVCFDFHVSYGENDFPECFF